MTEVVIKHAPATDDPKHVEAMIAKAEGREPASAAAEETPAERPSWLPEGFNTPEELAAAYAEATKKPEAAPKEDATETGKAAAEAAGLDYSSLEAKVASGEGLDDSDYEALAKSGITRELADRYIEGQRAIGEALTQRIYAHVGGADVLDSMVQWAAQGGMSQDEAKAFNAVIEKGTEGEVKLALDGLKAKYTAAGQARPALLGGTRTAAPSDVYASPAQLMADMRDPRYSKDPAYRADVEAKLARSSIL